MYHGILNHYSFQNQRNKIFKSRRIIRIGIVFRGRIKQDKNVRALCHIFGMVESRNRSGDIITKVRDGRQEISLFDFRLDWPWGSIILLLNALWKPFPQG
jgi:hypothetical protein